MPLGSNQKRFSRGAGLRRLSSLRLASSTSQAADKHGSAAKHGSGEDAIPTSYVLPDRSRAREFIRHIAQSSTSSSEFSLSVALSPPPPSHLHQHSPPPPLPTQSLLSAKNAHPPNTRPKSLLTRRASNLSTTSTLRTFPHGEVFDQSTAPSLAGTTPASSRSRKSSFTIEERTEPGLAGIGANGTPRETRAALMAVDSEIFSTGPMPEPALRKEVSMLSLKAAQQERFHRQHSDSALSSKSATLKSQTAPRRTGPSKAAEQGTSSPRLGKRGTLASMQQFSHSTPPLGPTSRPSLDTPGSAASEPGIVHVTPESGPISVLSAEALTTLASQMRRRSRSVNKIISADVANGWQLLWTLATADGALPRAAELVAGANGDGEGEGKEDEEEAFEALAGPEQEVQSWGRSKSPEPLRPRTTVPQESLREARDSPRRDHPKSKRNQQYNPTPSGNGIRPLRIARNTTSASIPSSEGSKYSSQSSFRPSAAERANSSTRAFSSSDSNRSTILGSSSQPTTASVYSVKSIAAAKPQLTVAPTPQRPPRSAKRMSVLAPPASGAGKGVVRRGSMAVPPALPASPALSFASGSRFAVAQQAEIETVATPPPPVVEPMVEDAQEQEVAVGRMPTHVESSEGEEQGWATAFSTEDEKKLIGTSASAPCERFDGRKAAETPPSGLVLGVGAKRRAIEQESPADSSLPPLPASAEHANGAGGASPDPEMPFSDLEIVAVTETESSAAASTSGDAPAGPETNAAAATSTTPATTRKPSLRTRRRRSRTWSASSARSRRVRASTAAAGVDASGGDAPRTSVRSLVEVLAEGESARMIADAQWEMLTGAALPGEARFSMCGGADTAGPSRARRHDRSSSAGRSPAATEQPLRFLQQGASADAAHGREQAMRAVEMWRQLAESYETGELGRMEDVVESAMTPASSAILQGEDDGDDSEALFSLIAADEVGPAAEAGSTRAQNRGSGSGLAVESSPWRFPAVPLNEAALGPSSSPPPDVLEPEDSEAAVTEEAVFEALKQEEESIPVASAPWMRRTLTSRSSDAGEVESQWSAFDTPMPGGFTPRLTPATTPLRSGDLNSGPSSHEHVPPEPSLTSEYAPPESSLAFSRQGLGLIFEDADGTETAAAAEAQEEGDERRRRDASWDDARTFKESKSSDLSISRSTGELTGNQTAAADSASDCFESADEGSEGDWGSRRVSQASRRHRSASGISAKADLSGTTYHSHGMGNSSHNDSSRTLGQIDQHNQAEGRNLGRPGKAVGHVAWSVDRSRARALQDGSSPAAVSDATFEPVHISPSESPSHVPVAPILPLIRPRRHEHARVQSVSQLVQEAEEQLEHGSIRRPLLGAQPMPSSDQEVLTQPLPQAPWIVSPDLDGANSEPETANIALMRLAKANRRRSTMARVRNSVIVEEAHGAEVLSARRASRRLSKLGFIDTSGPRSAGKTKSITARQRLTAFMNATPIMLVEPPSHSSWRSRLPASAFEDLLDRWGPLEMHRQEVLWELCETERSFVQAICSVQKIFALPLRTPEGQWIKGVPCSVARLFDWLEDIFQLHCKIHSVLQRARQQQGPMLISVADELLRFIPKLEAHQPYLVRFESVTQSIEEMLRSENSVFGQFVRMQMQIPECSAMSYSMSFSSFLLKPVQRLMKYPLFFKQLAELTPSTHPDHHATQALLQATDQVIRDMNDVKAREEDYRDLKQLRSRIKGLPSNFHLATRERRLLRQGAVTCVQLTPKEKAQIGLPVSLSDTVPGLTQVPATVSPLGFRAMSPASSEPRDSTSRNRTYMSSESDHPQTSTASGTSIGSCALDWDAYNAEPSFGRPMSFKSVASTRSEMSTMPSASAIAPRMPSLLSRKEKVKEKKTTIQAFVFSDLVLLATQEEAPPTKSKPLRKSKGALGSADRAAKGAGSGLDASYELIERAGLSRVLKVTDHSGKCPERPHLLELELLPLKTDSSYSVSFDKRQVASGPTTLFLAFQPSGQENSGSAIKGPEQESALWYRALERSFLWTLRTRKRSSLMLSSSKRESMLSLSSTGWRGALNQTAHADWPRRAEQVTDLVMAAARAGDAENLASLIQAGLPFPKSPSQQDLAVFAGEELRETHAKLYGPESELSGPTGEAAHIPVVGFGILDEAEEEREERRWWALRLVEIRQAAEAEREIDAMVEQLRSDGPGMRGGGGGMGGTGSSGNSPIVGGAGFGSETTLQQQMQQSQLARQPTNGARRKVRQGVPVLRSDSISRVNHGHGYGHGSGAGSGSGTGSRSGSGSSFGPEAAAGQHSTHYASPDLRGF